VSEDEVSHGGRGSTCGEDATTVVDDGEMIREGGEIEIESIANAKGVELGGQDGRGNPEINSLARFSMHRASNHGVKGREDSVKESRTWG
jgi:hypothetical protein